MNTTAVFRTRIGRVKLKNGAELRLLPSAREQTSKRAWGEFELALKWMRELYADSLGGFVLVPWDADGSFNTFVVTAAAYPSPNDLPVWIAEAIRRDSGEVDARRVVRRTLGME